MKNRSKTAAALLAVSTLWCLMLLAAPLFRLSWVYEILSRVCHQQLTRSWYLAGEPLPVCIRCASIYFAFTVSLWLGIKSNARWLRLSLVLMMCEFVFARLVIDAAVLRSITGAILGLSAAPFIKQGVEEIREAM